MSIITHPEFFVALAPYAEKVHQATGALTGVVMALAAEETGYGSSQLARENNMTGIRFVGQPQAQGNDGGFATYATLDDWASDMARVLNLDLYAAVRKAQGPSAQLTRLAESPYNGEPDLQKRYLWADGIMQVYTEQGLAQYDAGGAGIGTPAQVPDNGGIPAGYPQVSVSGNAINVDAGTAVAGLGALGIALVIAAVASAVAKAVRAAKGAA